MDHRELTTIHEAREMLNMKSRNSIEHHIKSGKIRFIWLTPKLRLLFREDIEVLKKYIINWAPFMGSYQHVINNLHTYTTREYRLLMHTRVVEFWDIFILIHTHLYIYYIILYPSWLCIVYILILIINVW